MIKKGVHLVGLPHVTLNHLYYTAMEDLQWKRWAKFISLQVGPHEKSIITPELKWLSTAFRPIHIKSRWTESKCYYKIQVLHMLYSIFFYPIFFFNFVLSAENWRNSLVTGMFLFLLTSKHRNFTTCTKQTTVTLTILTSTIYGALPYKCTLNSCRCALYSFGCTYMVVLTQ
jgi:hypothetical protein